MISLPISSFRGEKNSSDPPKMMVELLQKLSDVVVIAASTGTEIARREKCSLAFPRSLSNLRKY